MSRARVTILCIAVGLTGLVVNSVAAYAVGLRPAIVDGVVFDAVVVAWAICWITYALAVPAEHAERRDQSERTRNFAASLHYMDGDDRSSSGSWRRPPLN